MGWRDKIRRFVSKAASAVKSYVSGGTARGTSTAQASSTGGFSQQSTNVASPTRDQSTTSMPKTTGTSGFGGSSARSSGSSTPATQQTSSPANPQYTPASATAEVGEAINPGGNEAVAIADRKQAIGLLGTAAVIAGGVGAVAGVVRGIGAASRAQTLRAVILKGLAKQGKTLTRQSIKVGRDGNILRFTTKQFGSAGTIKVNSATVGATRGWLSKLAAGFTNPDFVAGMTVAAIGSYPFAGFIKEEALQTIGFAVYAAHENNDVDGMRAALDLQQDVLNNDFTESIMAGIPFVNVLYKLQDFYEAARLKMTIDEKGWEDLKIRVETGETPQATVVRNQKEEADQYQANIDYYNDQRKLLLQWEIDAKRDARDDDAAFWAAEAARQRELEAADRQAIADFWEQYRIQMYKWQQESAPSNLKFGLL